MPKAKALATYRPIFGIECLEPDANLVLGLRRRIASDEIWVNGLVEIAVLKSSDVLDGIRKTYPQHRRYMVASARIFYETSLIRKWREAGLNDLVHGYVVIVDIDPFHVLETLAERSRVTVNRGNIRMPDGDDLKMFEFVCIASDAEPNLLHFTLCSGPFIEALVNHCRRHRGEVVLGGGLGEEQDQMLRTVASHLVREEPSFGFDFWD